MCSISKSKNNNHYNMCVSSIEYFEDSAIAQCAMTHFFYASAHIPQSLIMILFLPITTISDIPSCICPYSLLLCLLHLSELCLPLYAQYYVALYLFLYSSLSLPIPHMLPVFYIPIAKHE